MQETVSIVIFGASGDLTHRKLIPSLYDLYLKGRLPKEWRIIGMSRSEYTDDEFREYVEAGVKEFSPNTYDAAKWRQFAKNVVFSGKNCSTESLGDFRYIAIRLK